MPKFTEGPWVVEWGTKYPHIKSMDGSYILEPVTGRSIVRTEADAHLIAAAPDMYEALEECAMNLSFLAGHLEGRIGEGAQAEMLRLAGEAEEILAKARGES